MRGIRETWKRWKSGKTVHYDTFKDLLYMCFEGAHKTFESGLEYTQWCQRRKFGGYSGQETFSRELADRCRRSHESNGVWDDCRLKKGRHRPSRFVRQFLEDLDDLRRTVYKAQEGDRAAGRARN